LNDDKIRFLKRQREQKIKDKNKNIRNNEDEHKCEIGIIEKTKSKDKEELM